MPFSQQENNYHHLQPPPPPISTTTTNGGYHSTPSTSPLPPPPPLHAREMNSNDSNTDSPGWAGQWAMWPNLATGQNTGSNQSQSASGMLSYGYGYHYGVESNSNPNISINDSSGSGSSGADGANGTAGMQNANGNGNGNGKQEFYDTYEAPAITLGTGDRFLQLLEAKLSMMNPQPPQQPQQQEPTLSPHYAVNGLGHGHGHAPLSIQSETVGPLACPSQQRPIPTNYQVPSQSRPFPQHPVRHNGYNPTASTTTHSTNSVSATPYPSNSLSPENVHTNVGAQQQNVSVIKGLQPSHWTWQSMVSSNDQNQYPDQRQAQTQFPCRSPPRQQQQQSSNLNMNMNMNMNMNTNVDPSRVDALLRDWSQTHIQPDLVAPLPTSRPSSGSVSGENPVLGSQQNPNVQMPYPPLPYSGLLPRLPMTYQQMSTFSPAPTSSSNQQPPPPPSPSQHQQLYAQNSLQQTFTSPQRQHNSRPPPPPPPAPPYTSAQQHQHQQHLPSVYTQTPQTQALSHSIPSVHSVPGSRSHSQSVENSPRDTLRPYPQGPTPQGWPPAQVQAHTYPPRQSSTGGVSVLSHPPSSTNTVPPYMPSRLTQLEEQPESKPSFDSRVPSQNPWSSEIPTTVPLSRESSRQEGNSASSTPVPTKKFSLSTSVKGSTMKSMTMAKGKGGNGRKKGKKQKEEAEEEQNQQHDSSTSPEKKKRKVDKDIPVPLPTSTPALNSVLADPGSGSEVVSAAALMAQRQKEMVEKTSIACNMCRAKKLKCNGVRPKCYHCVRRGEDCCEYEAVLRRRGPGKQNKKNSESVASGNEDDGKESSTKKGKKRRKKGNLSEEENPSTLSSPSLSSSSPNKSNSSQSRSQSSKSHSHSRTLTHEGESEAATMMEREEREKTKIKPDQLKGMSSYLLSSSSDNNNLQQDDEQRQMIGMGMGFGGLSNVDGNLSSGHGHAHGTRVAISGSRFEISQARE